MIWLIQTPVAPELVLCIEALVSPVRWEDCRRWMG